ncbi:MAG: glycosyltransferase family 4 protein, partial [Elusimicrobia bacterium]|nr:glycosyltransferase family 4 protein [Elusimicrobiota bacterium]
MRILVLHQFFLGANDPGGSRFNELTRFWSRRGHDVTVVTGNLHHGTGRVDPRFRRRWVAEERLADGVRVLWCYVPRSYMHGYLGRFFGYVAFMVSSTLATLVYAGPQDVVIASSPPLTIGLNAWFIAAIKRIPFVFEIRDLWPEFAIEMGVLRNPILIKLAYALERFIYRRANRINVLTPAFRRHLTAKKGIEEGRIIHIPNGADLSLFRPGPKDNWVREKHGWGGRFVAIYVGAHRKANYLWQLFDAAEALREHPDILLALVGDGNERRQLAAEAARRRLPNLQMIGAQPKKIIGDFINAADVGVA